MAAKSREEQMREWKEWYDKRDNPGNETFEEWLADMQAGLVNDGIISAEEVV